MVGGVRSKDGPDIPKSTGPQGKQQQDPQQQQQQQQHPQTYLVLRVLLGTDPGSPYARSLLLRFHTVCREGRAAALRTIVFLRLSQCDRNSNKPYSFHRLLALLQAAARATNLVLTSDQVTGLLQALRKQQQRQQAQQGGGAQQRLLAAWPRTGAGPAVPLPRATAPSSISAAAPTLTAAVTSSGGTTVPPYQTTTSSSSPVPNIGSASSEPGGTWFPDEPRGPSTPTPRPALESIRVYGQPTGTLVQQLMQLLDALAGARGLETLELGDVYASLFDCRSPALSFMDRSMGGSKQRRNRPADRGTWRSSCKELFVGAWSARVELEDALLLVQHVPHLTAFSGFWLDISTLPQHVQSLQGLEQLRLGSPIGLDQPDMEDALGTLTNLQSLSVHACELEQLPAAFPRLGRLNKLDLTNTDVSLRVVEALCDISSLNTYACHGRPTSPPSLTASAT